VVSCYEAGLDGFWLHRFFVSKGVENSVVDSASIEVNRRYSTVALARKLLMALWRFLATGELPAGAVLKAEVSG
jgi:transposase